MRLLMAALLVTGSVVWAQQTGGAGFGRMINPSGIPPGPGGAGFGRMIYPGTGGPPAVVRPNTAGANAAVNGGRGPRSRGGRGPVAVPPPVLHGGHSGGVALYPVYYGGYYYPYDAPPAPTQGYEYDPYYAGDNPGQPSPVVIINQNFKPDTINPVVRDYSNTPLPEYIPPPQAPAQPTVSGGDVTLPALYFLIAMKDGTIYPVVAYWVEGDTLNYTTTQGARNRVSLELVNRDFSVALNKDRNVDFGLPDPPPAK